MLLELEHRGRLRAVGQPPLQVSQVLLNAPVILVAQHQVVQV
jgi:hypothetical protein